MKIVGLDLSLSSTGIAYTVGDSPVLTGTVPGLNSGMARLSKIMADLGTWIHSADLVCCEGISFGSNLTGHSEVVMLHGFVRMWLWKHEIQLALPTPSQIKKFVGAKEKDQISKEVFKRWKVDCANCDEADAVVALMIGRCIAGVQEPETAVQSEVIYTMQNPAKKVRRKKAA